MKYLLMFVLGFLVALCMAMSPEGRTIMLLEPVQPTSTIVLRSTYETGSDIPRIMMPYLNKGYIVKTIVTGGVHYASNTFTIIVLEKY